MLIVYFILSLLSCSAYYYWAKKKQIVDTPNERSSHSHQPVRGMGLAFGVLILAVWLTEPSNYLIYLGLMVALITGYVDDLKNLTTRIRLPLYFLAVGLAFAPTLLNSNWSIVIIIATLVIAVGIINAYNFMDGINGITGLYTAVFLISSLFLIGQLSCLDKSQIPLDLIYAGLIFTIVFGFFNYRKQALAFLGDAGSVALGLVVCLILLRFIGITNQLHYLVLVAVYGVDSVGTIVMRLLKKENIFEAHRSHLYQDLVHVKKWSHLQVAIFYACLQLIINLAYYFLFDYAIEVFIVSLIVLVFLYIFTKKKLGTLSLTN